MIFEYNGEKATLKEWAENLNISYNTLKSRVSRGTIDPNELFATHTRKPGPKKK
jgi:predicted site-specific integrase-resolvase